MMSNELRKAMNTQINVELNSAYFYYSQAAFFKKKTLNGFAAWSQTQAMEETQHALRFYMHLIERHEQVELKTIQEPVKTWDSVLASFKQAHQWEEGVTKAVNRLMDIAEQDGDQAAATMLNWFIAEQVEEENQTRELIEKLTFIGDAPGGLFMMDAALAQRAVTTQG